MTGTASRKRSLSPKELKVWVDKIKKGAAKIRESTFELGDLLNQAEAKLTNKDFAKVIAEAGLGSKTTAQNYMRVAACEKLRQPGIFEHLPDGVGALIDLAAWPKETLEKAIQANVLKPRAKRQDLRAWQTRDAMIQRRVVMPPDPDEIVGYIIADRDYADGTKTARLNARVGKFIARINALSEDIAFVATTSASSHHHEMRRFLLQEKIEKQFRFHDRDEYIRSGLAPIFGDFDEFRLGAWTWESWAPKYIAALVDGTAPDLFLSPSEIDFLRCQGPARRPFPDPATDRDDPADLGNILPRLEFHPPADADVSLSDTEDQAHDANPEHV